MTAVTPGVGRLRAATEVAGLTLRSLVTRTRLIALGALGAVVMVLGVVPRSADDPLEAATGLVSVLGLSILAPVATLVVSSAALGDLRDDHTLVYLWLRPVPRWAIAAGAAAAAALVAVPLVVVPVSLSAVISGQNALIGAAVLASTLAVVAYSGLFVLLGLVFSRAFLWGLGYILVWEGIVAGFGAGTARLSVRSYTWSIVARATDIDLASANRGSVVSVVVPLAIGVVAVALTAWRLAHQEID